MKKAKSFRKYLARFSEIFIFLFVLAVFAFSFYKILTISKILPLKIYGVSSQVVEESLNCGSCGSLEDVCARGETWCEFLREWCGRWCPPCPTPTPTPTPSPTPTPPPEVTPTSTPPPVEPTPTPSLPPPPTPTPTSPPPVGGPPGPPGPPVCGAATPSAPTLISATRLSPEQADLSWTQVTPVTHYSILYGLTSGNYLYGVANTGNVTSFAVGGLDSAADYCFAVRAVNDCAPSALSNEICTGVVVGRVLGVTTLADTGSFADELFQILFIIGSVCVGVGLKLFLPAKRLA